jgi:hypothetical protein
MERRLWRRLILIAMALLPPLGDRTMGLTMLAVLLAGWRSGLAGSNWSWTNITGWILGLFWVAMAAGSWLLSPAGHQLGLVAR